MELYQSVVFSLAIVINTCVSRELFAIPKPENFPDLVEETVKVLTSCYKNQTSEFVLAGKTFQSLLGTQQSVVLIDISAGREIGVAERQELRYKLKLFVVAASSSSEFRKILGHIKESHWWNHMASYLIIYWSPASKNGCSSAFEFLQIAWKMNLLNAKFVCFSQTNKRFVYGYNPYTNKAPKSWQLVNTSSSKNDQPWTLFEREYQEGGNVCNGLDFDKTANLDGYKIRATVKTIYSWQIDFNKMGVDSFGGLNGILNQVLFQALNANAELQVYNNSKDAGYLDINGNSVVMQVIDGNTDIVLNFQYLRDMQNYTFSTQCAYSGISILTQCSIKKSQLEKIVSVIDDSSRYGVFLVIIITFIFFKFFRGLDAITAILNLVRLICNSPLTKVPSNVPARIYLSSLFILIVTVQAIYQGQLSSLLTKSVSLPNVHTVQDLANRNCKVYGHKSYGYLFDDPSFEGRFIASEEFLCTKDVLRDTSAACIAPRSLVISDTRKLKLHLSKYDVVMAPFVYAIRKDWPLEQRFNMAIGIMLQAGIYQRRHFTVLEKESAIHKFYEKLDEKQKYEVIVLGELAFAFSILGIGLACATVVFVIEIGIYRIRKKIKNVHDEIRMLF